MVLLKIILPTVTEIYLWLIVFDYSYPYSAQAEDIFYMKYYSGLLALIPVTEVFKVHL